MKKHRSLSLKQTLVSCIFLLVFTGLTVFLGRSDDNKRFLDLTRKLFQEEMTSNTLNMHYTLAHPADFSIEDYTVILPCYDRQAELKSQAAAENLLSVLDTLDVDKLSAPESYTYRLLVRTLENQLDLNAFAYYGEPLSPHSGMQSQLPILLAEYTFRTERDVTDYLALLEQSDAYFHSLLTYEQEKAAAGLSMSCASLEKVKVQCDTIVTKEVLDAGTHFLQTGFTERLEPLIASGELTAEEAKKYEVQNDRLLRTVLLPAYTALADGLFLLEDETVPTEGLAAKPKGQDYYQYLLRAETGSFREIAEIKQLLAERFHTEYNAIHDLLAEHPELPSYLQKQAAEGEDTFPLHDAEDMLSDLQRRMADDFPALTIPPSVTVKAVSANLEDYTAPAFYLTAPLDDTDNNVIYLNRRQSPCGLELYTTLAHEGYPGHLYQTVFSNRLFLAREENPIRQVLGYGGYQEGWALYVEFLSYEYAAKLLREQGLEMDALCAELEMHHRNLQLCLYALLDIMIHYDNASVDQAAKLLAPFGITEASSVSAIYDYIVEEPCNYLKYYLGYLELLELQKEARTLWQEGYSDLRFHTFVLDRGPSDFTTLSEELHRISDESNAQSLSSSIASR